MANKVRTNELIFVESNKSIDTSFGSNNARFHIKSDKTFESGDSLPPIMHDILIMN